MYESSLALEDILAIVLLTLVFSIALLLFIRWLFCRKLVLMNELKQEDGFVSAPDLKPFIGKIGVAATVLRPVGTIELEGRRFDARSNGDFIQRGQKVIVRGIDGAQLVVDPVQ